MGARRFLTAEWRHVLMLNYEVEPTVLSGYVPRGTELDQHDGKTYLSLVAFQFVNTKLLGLAIPLHRHFEELNLRFYVRRQVAGETRRAVVFVREVVPRQAIAALARLVYNEPYITLPMRSHVAGQPPEVSYEWYQGNQWHTAAARAVGEGAIPAAASHEEFITEHYWGYTRQRDGGTIEYRVEHERWRVWPAADVQVTARLELLYGRLARLLTEPVSAFVADGSPVTVFQPRRLGAGRDSSLTSA